MEFHGAANAMKAGIYFSTAVSTVSPKYAQEIQTPEFGVDLDAGCCALPRQPDRHSERRRLQRVEPRGRRKHRGQLRDPRPQRQGGLQTRPARKYQLPVDLEKPVVAIVSRLTSQKGIDLIAQVIWAHSGDRLVFHLARFRRRKLRGLFPATCATRCPPRSASTSAITTRSRTRSKRRRHVFLMPSAYEPCGLNQMYSLKYGAVPIVRGVGGLDDTIRNFEPTTERGNGYKFYEYSGDLPLDREVL